MSDNPWKLGGESFQYCSPSTLFYLNILFSVGIVSSEQEISLTIELPFEGI